MNGKKVMLTIQGEKKEYPAGTSFLRIAQDYSDAYQDDIVLVLYNRRLRELNKCADGDGTVEFLTTADKTGKKAYRRSVTLLMQKAVYNLWGKGNISVRVKYSIGQGNYCELVKWENDTEEVVKVSGTEINKLKNEMYQMVVSDIEIHKESINTDDAVTRKNCSVTGEVPESIFMNSIITWIIFTDLWCHRPDICAIMM